MAAPASQRLPVDGQAIRRDAGPFRRRSRGAQEPLAADRLSLRPAGRSDRGQMGRSRDFCSMAATTRRGSQKLADLLAAVITENGGEVRLKTKVARILVENGAASGLLLGDGRVERSGLSLPAATSSACCSICWGAASAGGHRPGSQRRRAVLFAFLMTLAVDMVPEGAPLNGPRMKAARSWRSWCRRSSIRRWRAGLCRSHPQWSWSGKTTPQLGIGAPQTTERPSRPHGERDDRPREKSHPRASPRTSSIARTHAAQLRTLRADHRGTSTARRRRVPAASAHPGAGLFWSATGPIWAAASKRWRFRQLVLRTSGFRPPRLGQPASATGRGCHDALARRVWVD